MSVWAKPDCDGGRLHQITKAGIGAYFFDIDSKSIHQFPGSPRVVWVAKKDAASEAPLSVGANKKVCPEGLTPCGYYHAFIQVKMGNGAPCFHSNPQVPRLGNEDQ